MDIITDPQTYETSEIVGKSSDSKIFSNQRLLVIKNGFLYYFTNVPKKYKAHVPNVLNTLKQLPKSSIEIRVIQQIKMQSSNSPNLIIQFNQKDMILREDIRKSITDKNYKYARKQTQDLKEWKFTYSTVLNCRLWYTALLKLKSHFGKQQEKILQFFNHFDPAKRNSQLPPEIKQALKKQDDLKGYRKTDLNIVDQFKKQDLKKNSTQSTQSTQSKPPKPPKPQLPLLLPPEDVVEKQIPKQQQYCSAISSPSQMRQKKQSTLEVIKQEQQPPGTLKQDQSVPDLNSLQTPTNKLKEKKQVQQNHKKDKKQEQISDNKNNNNSENSSPLKLPISNEVSPMAKLIGLGDNDKEELTQQIIKQQRQRNDSMLLGMKMQLSIKDQEIKNLYDIIKNKNEQQKQKPTEELLKYSEDLYDNYKTQNIQRNTLRTVQLNQFSVQTDQEDDYFIQTKPNRTLESIQKNRYQSFLDDFNSTQRDTYNFYRKMDSLSFELEQNDRKYDNYDYYAEMGNIYTSNTTTITKFKQQKTNNQSHPNNLKFEQQIKKQIKLINYVQKMKGIAIQTAKKYIDQAIRNQIDNKLGNKNCIQFQSTLFYVKMVCSPGKIINISNNKQKLVYSNREHQNLKRQFKIYNILQDRIIKILQNKSNYPMRVPMTYHIQYKGYSALMKYLPYTKNIPQSDSHPNNYNKVLKLANRIIQNNQNLQNYEYSLIANRNLPLYLINVVSPYKITQNQYQIEQKSNRNKGNNKLKGQKMYSVYQLITQMRRNFTSTNTQYLFRQLSALKKQLKMLQTKKNLIYPQRSRKVQLKHKIMSIKQFILCRNLKNLYRSTQPFSSTEQQYSNSTTVTYSTFLQGYLSSPEQITELVSTHYQQNQQQQQYQTIKIQGQNQQFNANGFNGLFLSYFQQLFGFKVIRDVNLVQFYNQQYRPNKLQEMSSSYFGSSGEIQERQEIDYQQKLQQVKIQVYPICRGYQLAPFHANRLLDNLQLYIETERYNLVDTAIEIMHQIQHRKPERDIRLHLLIIKYKLKTMSPPTNTPTKNDQTQILHRCKIQLSDILQKISQNSVYRFQCQMLLIQCCMALEAYGQTLELIFKTVNNLEYMLSDVKNNQYQYTGGQIDDCLYLLAAEVLAKMGSNQQSLSIYKKLLTNQCTCISQQQIFVSLAEVSAYLMDSGPSDIIQLLLPLVSESAINGEPKNKNQLYNKQYECYISSTHSQIYNLLGHQYMMISNMDQAMKYYQYSMIYYLTLLPGSMQHDQTHNYRSNNTNKINSSINIDMVIDNCLQLFKIYNSRHAINNLNTHSHNQNAENIIDNFNRIIQVITANKSSSNLSYRIQTRRMMTSMACQLISSILTSNVIPQQKRADTKDILRETLEEMRDNNTQQVKSDVAYTPVKYEHIYGAILKLMGGKAEHFTQKQLEAFDQINVRQLQTHIIAMD